MYSNPLEGIYCSSCGVLVVREVSAHEICAMHPTTPDGRYFVVKGQLWRCSNPALSDEERQHLVRVLMEARRAVKEAKASENADELRTARSAVDQAKRALGERGPGLVERREPGLLPPQSNPYPTRCLVSISERCGLNRP